MHRSVLMRMVVMIVIWWWWWWRWNWSSSFHFKMMRLMLHFMIVLMQWGSCWIDEDVAHYGNGDDDALNDHDDRYFHEYAFKLTSFWSKQQRPFLSRIDISGGCRANELPPMILPTFSSCFQTMPTISWAQVFRGFLVVRFLLKKVQANESHFHSQFQIWCLLFVAHVDYNSKAFFCTLTSNNTFFSVPAVSPI